MPPKTFIRKPHPVEALQWDGSAESAEEILAWVRQDLIKDAAHKPARPGRAPLIQIELSNRTVLTLLTGDFLVREFWGMFRSWEQATFLSNFTEREES